MLCTSSVGGTFEEMNSDSFDITDFALCWSVMDNQVVQAKMTNDGTVGNKSTSQNLVNQSCF